MLRSSVVLPTPLADHRAQFAADHVEVQRVHQRPIGQSDRGIADA